MYDDASAAVNPKPAVHPNTLAFVCGQPVPYPRGGTLRNIEASKLRQVRFERRVLNAAGGNVCETDA